MISAHDIHAQLGSTWPDVLKRLGVAEQFLVKKPGPCPLCGGRDRFKFDNRKGRGDYFCRQCGAGDGFSLLQRVHGWDFGTVRRQVIEAARLSEGASRPTKSTSSSVPPIAPSMPSARVLRIGREAVPVSDCAEVIEYLQGRCLWPLPAWGALRAHPNLAYWQDGEWIGRFPGLLAAVRDRQGELVTLHATFVHQGRKLAGYEPRKLLSPLVGRHGCAVRLAPASGPCLGIGEGIETCLAASALFGLPVWAALNTSLLSRFDPPEHIRNLVVFADADPPGLAAADRLAQTLRDRLRVEIRTPSAGKDWADTLQEAS